MARRLVARMARRRELRVSLVQSWDGVFLTRVRLGILTDWLNWFNGIAMDGDGFGVGDGWGFGVFQD